MVSGSVSLEVLVRAPGVFRAIVERDIFEAARTIINARSFRLSDAQMLAELREVLVR